MLIKLTSLLPSQDSALYILYMGGLATKEETNLYQPHHLQSDKGNKGLPSRAGLNYEPHKNQQSSICLASVLGARDGLCQDGIDILHAEKKFQSHTNYCELKCIQSLELHFGMGDES